MNDSIYRTSIYLVLTALLLFLPPAVFSADEEMEAVVHHIKVEGAIHPVSMDYIIDAIDRAEVENAAALIIQLDTPGGLLESTWQITKAIMNSHVPVIVYVAPDGARAGSAGVFITLASHLAAMAPSTNIGAATPVGIGGAPSDTSEGSQSDQEAMRKKVTNDAVAQIRAMAERRGRNADWAEEAVREAVSITATEALELNVIEIIAENIEDLLEQADGRIILTVDGEQQLIFENAVVQTYEPSWREQFLNTIANPNLAYILLMIGFYGLLFELYNPGAIIPGVIGVIALIVAFFAMQTLPVNWAGLLLIVVALVMFLLEIKVASYGFLTFGGVVSLTLGSIMLFEGPIPAMRVSLSVVVPAVIVSVVFFAFAITMGIRAQKNRVTSGVEGLTGEFGEAASALNPRGKVKIGSEYWNAEAVGDPIKKGERIVVVSGDRLNLKVRRIV
jgi:membrane-bound serine protease (ClpP class)